MKRFCKNCNKEFTPTNGNVKKGRGIYCCPECYWKSLKGKKPSVETLFKRSISLKLIKRTKEWNKKIGDAHRGKKASVETRIKLSIAHLGQKAWNKGDGISSERDKAKNSIDYRLWREAVFAKDNFTCQKCNIRGGKLRSHHIKNFAQYPELRFAIDNGITFCENCHSHFHKKYGYTNNNEKQVKKFIEPI